ncbi:hypothetical protein LJN214_000903 [Mesorhizobium sp. LjNodule214]
MLFLDRGRRRRRLAQLMSDQRFARDHLLIGKLIDQFPQPGAHQANGDEPAGQGKSNGRRGHDPDGNCSDARDQRA